MNGPLSPEERSELGKPADEAVGLPPRLYTDTAIFAAEKETIFRREWMAVFHESTIPRPRDYRVVEIAGDSLIVVRGDDGRLRCFHNICRHRGAQPASGSGNCRYFRCPYHLWTYDLTGRLVGAPTMRDLVREGVRVGNIGLNEVRVDTWLGYVFVNLDGAAQPLAERLAPLTDVAAQWQDVEVVPLYELHYPGEWNWKLTFENAADGYHNLGTHQATLQDVTPGEKAYTGSTAFDVFSDLSLPFAEGKGWADDTGAAVAFDNLPDWVPSEVRDYAVWPTFIFRPGPFNIISTITIPGPTVNSVTFVWTCLVRPETRASVTFDAYLADQLRWSREVQAEDQEACRMVWTNMHSDGFIPGPYAVGERCVYHFDQWYLARMSGARPEGYAGAGQ
jgi:Rieske 2Fe-2S family protein